MKRLFCSLLALGICLTPITVTLTPQPSWAQTQTTDAELQQLINLAFQHTRQGQPLKALKTWQQILMIARQRQDRTYEALALLNIGLNYNNIGQRQQALDNYDEALKIWQEIRIRQGEATTLNNIGEVYSDTGKPQQALDSYNQALSISKEVSDRNNRNTEAKILNNIGLVYSNLGQPQQALYYFNQAFPISIEVSDRNTEATILNNIGGVYANSGKPQQALEKFNQALLISKEMGTPTIEATTLNNIGKVYSDMGQPQQALEKFNQALLIQEEIDDRAGKAKTLNNIGLFYSDRGQSQQALDYYNQALPIQKEVNDRAGEAVTLSNIGSVCSNLGKPQQALEKYNQALLIQEEVDDSPGKAKTLNNIGQVYSNLGKPQQALEKYDQALLIQKEVGDQAGKAVTLSNIGSVYKNSGNPQQALYYFNQALSIQKEVDDRAGEATTLNNIGVVQDDLGQHQKALDYYHQALPIQKEVDDRVGIATTLNNIGEAYRNLEKPQQALDYYNQSLSISKEVNDRTIEAITLSNIGLVYQNMGLFEQAIQNFEASVEITLAIRSDVGRKDRETFIQAEQVTAIALIDLLIRQNQPEKAFEWANLATTFDLADYTRLIDAKVTNPDAQKALDQLNEKYQQIAYLQQQNRDDFSENRVTQIRELEKELNQEREAKINQYPEIAELLEIKTTDITQLRQNIPQNTVVIQPILLTGIKNIPNTVAIFVLTRDKLTVIQKTLPEDFDALLSQFKLQLEDNNLLVGYNITGGKLYELFIRPVEEKSLIPSNYQVAIIATGKLQGIPFEPLYDERLNKVLLEKYPISYLTRISTRPQPNTATPRQSNKRVLVLANPKPTQQELKGTEVEADYLKKNFPESEVYLHEKATLNTFTTQSPRFSILHLGTHGCFNITGCPELGMQPNTILFANNQQYPIADAALLGLQDTELLVLGACETAKDVDGVGLAGLAYIWERAGAKSVIASLWNATDKTTKAETEEEVLVSAELMKRFYQNLQEGMSKAEAMQKAKLSLMNLHPYFWSPFILIGDAQ